MGQGCSLLQVLAVAQLLVFLVGGVIALVAAFVGRQMEITLREAKDIWGCAHQRDLTPDLRTRSTSGLRVFGDWGDATIVPSNTSTSLG